MTRADAEVFLGRRYLAKGFVEDAMRVFLQHPDSVATEDWQRLRDGLLERGRITDAVSVCRLGKIPVPQQQLLELGDEYLRRGEIDRAIDIYDLVEADRDRWERVVDRLIEYPDRQQQARSIATRYLDNPRPQEAPTSPPLKTTT
ncbi:MAG: hypothetical protein H6Q33_4369 [Deltaproteobacteria bacterium]|nr:hypothetical protein [Deltaproteobacteria bacterium]